MSDAIGALGKIDITHAVLADTKVAFTVTAAHKKCTGKGKVAADALLREWRAIPTPQSKCHHHQATPSTTTSTTTTTASHAIERTSLTQSIGERRLVVDRVSQ